MGAVEQGEFRHPRLVPLYDARYSWGQDDDFFRTAVGRTPSARVLDLGCGTGRLSLALAAAGHTVTGVDPAPASLDAAHAKAGARAVTWVQGTSSVLPEGAFDVAVMTSHVAQFIVEEDQWTATLDDLHRALAPAGRLVFDTRDPRARAWQRWNPQDSRTSVSLPDGQVVQLWSEVASVEETATGPVVAWTEHYRFPDGVELASSARMRFRTEAHLRDSLLRAGFTTDAVHGGWRGEPVGHGDGELLVQARTAGSR